MSDLTGGLVVPFALSAQKLRQRAAEHRRAGRTLEAAALLRQALERDGALNTRLELASALHDMHCYEQASTVLYRMLSRADVPLEAWLLLARCQYALGHTVSAQDCLYHLLAVDPYSDLGDRARGLLGEVEQEDARHEPFRLNRLQQRALKAWRGGDRTLSEKRFRRAMRISGHPERISATMGLLYLAQDDYPNAYRSLFRALRRDPAQPRTNTAMCLVLHGMGQEEAALAQLRASMEACRTPESEALFVTTAMAMDQTGEAIRYLRERLRRAPYRASLLHLLAVLLAEDGQESEARTLWQRLLQLDPGDQRARIQLQLLDAGRNTVSFLDDRPLSEHLQDHLIDALSGVLVEGRIPSADVLLTPGSETRQLMDWILENDKPALQTPVINLLLQNRAGDEARHRAYLHELLTLPTLQTELRHRVLLYLHSVGDTEPAPVMMGVRIGMAQCVDDHSRSRRWPMFLSLYLQETRGHRQSLPMACCAADWWRGMTDAQRTRAIGSQSYAYVKAMEILYLRYTDQEEKALRVAAGVKTSSRRISRIMRQLHGNAEPLKGD